MHPATVKLSAISGLHGTQCSTTAVQCGTICTIHSSAPVHLIPSCTGSCNPISNSPGNILALYFHRFYSMVFGHLLTFNFSQYSSSSNLKPHCAAPVSHFISSFRKILGPSKTLAKSAFLQINQLFSSDSRRPVVAF